MKKRIRILMPVLVTLALVISVFALAVPAMASEITITKNVTDPFAVNIYYVGDTIYYEMTIENPATNAATNTLTRIWDTLPDGTTVIEFLAPGETLVLAPGDVEYFYAEYVVDEADIIWIPALGGYGVKNQFETEGYDDAGDDIYGLVTKNSQVIRPEISIEKLVDFDNDDTFTDLETYYAGEPADWAIVVTNTGDDPVYDIYVSDDNMGVDFYGPFDLLNPGDSEVIPVYTTYPMVDTVNTACAEGVDDLDNPVGPVCDPAEVLVLIEDLTITKTVETYFTRTHEWDIEKWVDTENGYTVDGGLTPKIWLWEDTSGDEWATWHVCVTYEGYEDSDFNVSGTVTIENTGTADAVITDVEDLLCGVPIDVDFGGVTFPYTLVVGDTLVGTYDEDVADMLVDCDNVVTVTTEWDEYGTSEPVIWGDPDEEYLDIVDIEDDSDLFGLQFLGTLYADDYDEGDVECFTYDRFFAWTDYTAPGPYDYEDTATIVQTGQYDDALLRVNWLDEILEVSKTVETSYTRTHEWDIEKWVETENGYTVDGGLIPKIWLWEDGSGDEWATWHVCVDYMGYEDSDFNVSGTVTIENIGDSDAVITSIDDLLGGVPITLDCGVMFPYTLVVGDTLVCTYDEDGYFEGNNEVMVYTLAADYGTSESIVWGDPEEEVYECVDIEDDSEFLADPLLGTLCAPESACFTYDEYFEWTDYTAPGPYDYENTATIVQTGQWDDALLRVNWMEPAELGDFVWDDQNQDGIQDPGELGIASVTVNLYDCGGTPLGSTATDGNGYYLFDMLMPGDYQVEFILPADYVFSPQYQGADPALDSNADTVTGFSECVTLAAGESNLTIDAGMYVPPGGEGCTPGYWKNNADKKGAVSWVPTGYSPSDRFSDVFGVVITVRAGGRRTITDPTLLQALQATGGGVDALARHAVAALLNAAHPDIAYGIGNPAGVIALVHDALVSPDPGAIGAAHTLLAGYNEAGCPINQSGEPE